MKLSALMRKKSVEQTLMDTQEAGHALKRTLGVWDLMVLGIAVAVGAGIFSVGAKAASAFAGPAVVVSFVIAAATCALAILCYAEFASTMPVAGSAYTYTYASMGEFFAWVIGWDLILEMFAASAVVSKYWGVYLNSMFQSFNLSVSQTLHFGNIKFDWAPVLVVAVFTFLLAAGTKLSARVGGIFTIIKILIVALIVIAGLAYFQVQNLDPFVPEPVAGAESGDWLKQSLFSTMIGSVPSHFGFFGIIGGASLVFFAFIGFDVVATSAEETKNPQRTLVRGIFSGLGIVTLMYLAVSVTVVGMAPYNYLSTGEPSAESIVRMQDKNPAIYEHLTGLTPQQLGNIQESAPSLTKGFLIVGAPNWVTSLISIGIVIGLTTVVMVLLLGLSRVLLAMSRDGLLPRRLSVTSGKNRTPVRLQVIGGIAVAFTSGFFDVDFLDELVNVGTLAAFILVSIGVIILRYRRPDLPRAFKVPLFPVVPALSALACLYLMLNLTNESWLRFVVWFTIGLVIYFGYGFWNSRQAAHLGGDAAIRCDKPIYTDVVKSLDIGRDEGGSARN